MLIGVCGMRDTELQLLVFYESKEITRPAAFIQEVLKLWKQNNFEPFQLYTRSTPAPEITQELLEAHLGFGKVDKTNSQKALRLKTSLKRDNILADFLFSHPSCNLQDALVKFRKGSSSISITLPLNKLQKQPYQLPKLMEFYVSLFTGKQVSQAHIAMNSKVEMEEGIYQTLFDMLNYLHEKEYVIPCSRLDWAHFFSLEEIIVIQERFEVIGGSLGSFCETHGLYVQSLEQSNGALLCMDCEPEDTPEFFQQVLRNNQDFWQVMKK